MKSSAVIGIVVAIVVVAGGAYALTRKKTDTPTTNTTSQTSSNTTTDNSTTTENQTDNTTASGDAQSNGTTISYNGSGFSPDKLTVKSGTTVTIKNGSSSVLQFDSDPHPSHTGNTELNVNIVSPGSSKTFMVDKVGTWGYHNHLNSSEKGSIVVE